MSQSESGQHGRSAGRTAAEFAAKCDWPGYFTNVAGQPARQTLLDALDLFDRDGPVADGTRLAVDLGSGEGRDVAVLLQRGWRVLAIDGHADAFHHLRRRSDLVHLDRLETRLCSFENVQLPPCDLLNASFALPFCHPDHFDRLWAGIVASIRPGGRFAGQLFGDRDDWASIAGRTHHRRAELDRLLDPFDVENLQEEETDRAICSGKVKHWHVFHIIARRLLT